MARPRDPRRDEAKQLWLKSNGELKLVELAEQMGVTSSTIRKWKSTDKWDNELNGSAPKSKGSALKRSRGQPGAPKGNKNAVGNNGGAPKRNQNAVTHGFFAKFLPDETLEIMKAMEERSPADLIYDQIQIQYAAIIRAQKIMFVEDKDDMAKEKSQEGWGESGADKYDIQFAWDRHATFLNAQSRAMSELRSLIRQFDELAHIDDERRLKLEQMQLGIEKTKVEIAKKHTEIAKIRGDDDIGDYEDDGFEAALDSVTEEVWADEDDEAEEE
ncbi:phage terminase small subunit [Bacillus sp. FJAT-52991]|uniref:Phage terminase small subunit n=1 Tax=Bacillus kandeliae TaxID=3129297 RepID=A0ABZ2N2V0_9BACI